VKKLLIGVLVVAALGAIVFFSLRAGDGGNGVDVDVEAVASRELTEVVKTSGQVDARVKVNISSPLIAKITDLFVQEGDEVKAGDRFLELEKEAFIAQRDDWTSRLAVARNDVAQAEVSLADARLKSQRAQRLRDAGISSVEALEAAQLAETSAELQLERARQSVEQATANLSKARDDLAKTTIFSPIAGRVVTLNAEEGEVVVSGTMNNPASVIGTVADLSEILAEVDVDETEIVKVDVGQSAELRVEAVADRVYKGRVVEVGNSGYSKQSQPDVTFFKVKILFEDADVTLRPGMSVRADIRTESAEDALVVPIQAVVDRLPVETEEDAKEDAEEVSVVFVVEDGKAVQRAVETGLSDDTHVQVRSGVSAGEQVITGPYRTLKKLENGDEIQVREKNSKDDEGDDASSEE
jgi:HlyD family secretion protein